MSARLRSRPQRFGLLAIATAVACATATKQTKTSIPAQTSASPHSVAPNWMMTGPHQSSEGGIIFATASAGGIANARLRKHVVENRARAEMRKTLEAISAIAIDRGCTLSSINPSPEAIAQQEAEHRLRVFFTEAIERALEAIEFVGFWTDLRDNTLHVLAKVDLNPFIGELEAMPDVPESAQSNLRKALGELDTEPRR